MTGMPLTLREKFDLRMNKLPHSAIVIVKIITDKNGEIINWSVKQEDKLEGKISEPLAQ